MIKLRNWYNGINKKQRIIIWAVTGVVSIPVQPLCLISIPFLLILIYLEYGRN